jgi:hypothetical protein
VAVVLEPQATDRPVVALMTPDKPTVVLSQPGSAKPGAHRLWSSRLSRSTQAANSMSAAGKAEYGGEALSQRCASRVGDVRRRWALRGHDQ